MAMDFVSSVVHDEIVPVIVDQVLKSNPFLVMLLRNRKWIQGGSQFRVPVMLSKNTSATSYAGADPLPVNYDEEWSSFQFNMAQYAATIPITGQDDMRFNTVNAVVNGLDAKVKIAEASLREQIGTDLQLDGTGNSNKNILGLIAAVDDSTNVVLYGNLSRTVYPVLKSQYSANGGTLRALTYNLMVTQYINASKDNDRPTAIFVPPGGLSKYLQIVLPFERIVSQDTALGNLGFQNAGFQGRPVIMDDLVNANKMWILNMKHLALYFHKERFFRWTGFIKEPRQDSMVGTILCSMQLVNDEPRKSAAIVDLDPTL